jgi:hypothetical protein
MGSCYPSGARRRPVSRFRAEDLDSPNLARLLPSVRVNAARRLWRSEKPHRRCERSRGRRHPATLDRSVRPEEARIRPARCRSHSRSAEARTRSEKENDFPKVEFRDCCKPDVDATESHGCGG